jgi:hypothetical protein
MGFLQQGGENMTRKVSSCSAFLFLMAAVAFFPVLLQAQYNSAQGTSEPKNDQMAASKETATGCLQKGDEANGYTLTTDDGKIWELQSTKVKLADHVGHKVTVMGAAAKGSDAMEKKKESSETKETEGKEHGDLKVSSLKMVSESCK